jgi:SAM-dependent methyltransferase
LNLHSPYDDFAWVYNKHWGPYANQAFSIIEKLILHHLPKKARILDLCCGTGQLAHLFSERGYRITGIDSAEEMIRFASANAPNANFLVHDARYFHFPPIYDAVISTYDSLNFVTEPEGLMGTFQNVFASLKEGGCFLFDLNTEAGYLDHWDDGTFDIVEDDHVCIVQTSYDQNELPRFDVTIFRLLDGWQRSDITLFQRYYPESEIREFLATTGFIEIHTYGYHDETGLGELTSESERMYFVCSKPPGVEK